MESVDHQRRLRGAAFTWAALAAATLAACGGGGGGSSAPTASQQSAPAAEAPASAVPTAAAPGPDTVAPAAPAPVPAPAPAPSPAPASTDLTPVRLRVATLAYSRLSSDQQTQAAKFGFVVLHYWPSLGASTLQSQVNNLKAKNPQIKLAEYTILNEWATSPPVTNTDNYPVTQQILGQDWWAHDATTGALVQWTTVYGASEVNLTAWAPADASGQRWPQWKAHHDWDTLFQYMKGIDYIFNDNTMWQPRVTADWMRVGSNQSASDPVIQAAYRQGFADFWTVWHQIAPGLKIMGNADNDLSMPQFKGQLEGAFNECLMGKSWSLLTWSGWANMMKRYTTTIANTKAPHDVIFQACGPNGFDADFGRYGLASALLQDGYFAYTVDGQVLTAWLDEFDAPLGSPTEAPPTAAATSNGVWMRHYSNGLVLVNPGKSAATVDVGSGYRTIAGTQSPGVNTGQAVSSVTLPAGSGLILLKQ
jgi:hypothetical protein